MTKIITVVSYLAGNAVGLFAQLTGEVADTVNEKAESFTVRRLTVERSLSVHVFCSFGGVCKIR